MLYKLELGVDFMPKGEPQRLTNQGVRLKGITWAADGQSVIYASSLGSGSLWRVSISGDPPERLELAARAAGYPAIARSGNKMVFPAGGQDVDLWRLRPGSPPESILSSTQHDFEPHLSEDGKNVVFATERSGRGNEIWIANVDGTGVTRLTESTGRGQGSPRWSPDSRRVAFDSQGEDGQRDIFVIDAAGGQPQRLTTFPSNEIRPSWSRDGRWVYFQSRHTGRPEVWRVPASGGDSEQVTFNGGRNAVESPDRQILYYQRDDVVFARPLTGGPEKRVVASVNTGDFFPVENGIYYVTHTDRRLHLRELRFLNIASGKTEVLNRFQSLGGQGLSVSPDRKTILYAGIEPSGGEDLMLIQNFR